jgi:hypothetical protein
VKRVLIPVPLLASLLCSCGEHAEPKLTGTGSTFVYPLMTKWVAEYEKAKGVSILYESVGSGAGIQRLRGRMGVCLPCRHNHTVSCLYVDRIDDAVGRVVPHGGEVVNAPYHRVRGGRTKRSIG